MKITVETAVKAPLGWQAISDSFGRYVEAMG